MSLGPKEKRMVGLGNTWGWEFKCQTWSVWLHPSHVPLCADWLPWLLRPSSANHGHCQRSPSAPPSKLPRVTLIPFLHSSPSSPGDSDWQSLGKMPSPESNSWGHRARLHCSRGRSDAPGGRRGKPSPKKKECRA